MSQETTETQVPVSASEPLPYAPPVDAARLASTGGYLFASAVLACRLLGIVALLYAVEYLPWLPLLWRYEAEGLGLEHVAIQLLPLVCTVAIGTVLLFNSRRLAEWMLRDVPVSHGETEARHHRSGARLQAIGFSIAGAWLVLSGLPDLAEIVWHHVTYDSPASYYRGESALDYVARYVGPVIRLIVGTWLFFGASGLAVYWHRVRAKARASNNSAEDVRPEG